MDQPSKHCTDCDQVKPLDQFHANKGTRSGVNTYCKPCVNKRSKAWRDKNKERYAESYRKWAAENRDRLLDRKRIRAREREYRLSDEEYRALLAKQGGRCAICGRGPGDKALAVDHCHASGRVRGLLCGQCNRSIGLMQDDPKILRAAIAYLTSNSY